MKIFKIINLFLVLSLNAFTQDNSNKTEGKNSIEIDGFYIWTMTGQNLSVMGTKYIGKHGISIGLKYHINKPILDNQNFSYKHRFIEREFPEALGLNLGYKFEPLNKSKVVRPYLYYMLQISYLRNVREYTSEYDGSSLIAGMTIMNETSPFFIFENSIGIGLQTKLYKNIYLNQSAGIGMAGFLNMPDYYSRFNYEWVTSFKLGMSYRIK